MCGTVCGVEWEGYMWIQASSQTFPAGVVKRTCCQNGGSEEAVLTLMASAD